MFNKIKRKWLVFKIWVKQIQFESEPIGVGREIIETDLLILKEKYKKTFD